MRINKAGLQMKRLTFNIQLICQHWKVLNDMLNGKFIGDSK